jgi:hypothetical protein
MSSVPVYRCKRVAGPPSLDGGAWNGAEMLKTAFHLLGKPQERSASFLSLAAMWDDDALYVSYLSDPSPVPVTMRDRDDDLFDECAVEVFLRAGDGYYEVEVNPLGTVLDLYFPEVEVEDWRATARFDVQGMRWQVGEVGASGRWWAQLAIPWDGVPKVTRGTHNGEPCVYGNFARSQVLPSGEYDLTSWSPAREAFCELDAMGCLVLVP